MFNITYILTTLTFVAVFFLIIYFLTSWIKQRILRLKESQNYSKVKLALLYSGWGVGTLICVLGIMFVLWPFFLPRETPQYRAVTEVKMERVGLVMSMVFRDCGRLPPEDSWQEALTKPGFCKQVEAYADWNLVKDAWGNSFVYKNYSDYAEIKSYGRDGKEGGVGMDEDLIYKFNLDGSSYEAYPFGRKPK